MFLTQVIEKLNNTVQGLNVCECENLQLKFKDISKSNNNFGN